MLQLLYKNLQRSLICVGFLLAFQFFTGTASGQTTLAQWATSGSHTPTTASSGNASMQLINSQGSYNASSACSLGPYYANTWALNGYWQFDVKTTGYNTIKIASFQTKGSNTGPRDFKIQYNNNVSGGWQDLGSTYTVGTSCATFGPYTLPASCNNVADVSVRFVLTQVTTDVRGDAAVGSAGTNYMQVLTVTGVAITNTSPTFVNGSPQSLVVCQNATATDITSKLTVSDVDAAQTETWSVTGAPSHGTMGGFTTTHASGSASITPSGLTYTPTAGYSGTDAFTVQVSDGTATASTVINVTVNPSPTTVTVTGAGTFCGSTTLNASNGSSGTIYYQGSTSNGTSTATPSTSQLISTTGTYYFNAQSAAGCWGAQGTAVVSINPIPAAVTVTGGGTVCGSATLNASGGGGGTIYYEGISSGGTSTVTASSSQVVSATGNYYFNSRSAAGCWGTQGSATVSVNPIPVMSVTPTGGPSCLTMTATGATTYSWAPGTGLNTTIGATVIASPTVLTNYTVTGTSAGCTGTYSVTVTPASVAISNTSPATGSIYQGTTNNVLQTYNLAVTSAAATLSGLSVTTAGTYGASDIMNIKCWYASSSTFNAGTATLLSTITSPGTAGTMSFPSFIAQTISSGTTGYIFITADLASGATAGNNISIGTTTFSNFTLCSATLTGTNPVAASNTQTIAYLLCSGTPAAGTATPSPDNLCTTGTSTLTFTGGATGAGLTYQWSSSSDNTPPGTPISGATATSYTASVSATTYFWCTTTCTATSLSNISAAGIVSLNPVPSLSSASTGGVICAGATLSLSASTPLNVAGYSWSGPNLFASTLQNPTISGATAAAAGVYTVTVNNGSGPGCNAVYTTTATVNALPISTGAGNSGPSCAGGTVTLNDNSSNATGWSWSGPGFSSSLQTPTVTPSVTTTYSLTVSSTGTGCNPATVYTTMVTVSPLPTSTGASNNGPLCIGTGSVILSANSSNATSWSWTGPGFTSASQNPVVTPSVTGTYSLVVSSAAGTGCNPSTVYTTTVTVNSLPTVNVTPAGGSYCSGSGGLSMTASGATTYSWTPSTGLNTSSGATVLGSSTVTTTYTVTGTNSAGCTATNTVTTTYGGVAPPTPTVTPTYINACVGGPTNLLTASEGTAGPFTATSTTMAGNPGANNGVGTSTVTVTVPAGATITSATATINVGFSTYQSDYLINLKAPNGNILNLIYEKGSSSAGSYTGTVISSASSTALSGGSPFTGTYKADASGSVGPSGYVSNESDWTNLISSPSGTWTLVLDNTYNSAKTVTFTNWTITINYTLPAVSWSPTTYLYTTAGAGTPYGGGSSYTVYENPTTAGVTTYTATATSGSCTSQTTITATVNAIPTPITVSGGGTFCGSTTLNATGGTGGTIYYQGLTSGGTSTLTATASQSVTATGTYYFNSLSGVCWGTQGSSVVSINPVPAAVTVTGGGTVCGNTTLNASGGSGGTIYYQGMTSGGTSTVTPTNTELINTNGTYYFSSVSAAGCWGTQGSAIVSVNPVPTINVTPMGGPSCLNMTASGATTYSWSPSAGLNTTTGATVTASPASETIYTVTGTSAGCSATNNVTVIPANVAVSSTTPATASVAQGTSDYLLQTYNLAVTSADATLSGLSITTAGTYSASDITDLKCWYSSFPTFNTSTAALLSTYTSPGTAGSIVFPSFAPQTISSGTTGYIFITADVSIGAGIGNNIYIGTTAFSDFSLCAATLTGTNPVPASNTQTFNSLYCNGAPTAGTVAASPDNLCTTGSSLLTLMGGATGLGLTYQWSSSSVNSAPGTAIPGATNQTYTDPSISATTYYWCTTTCAYSSLSSVSAVGSVSLNPVPSVASASTGGTLCVGATLSLFANTPSNVAGYSWSGPNLFSSTLQNPTLGGATAAAGGVYTLTVNNGSGTGCTATYTTNATVNTLPSSAGATNNGPSCAGGTVTLNDNSSNATGWLWNGPGFSSPLQTPAVTPSVTTTYSLTVSSTGIGCSPVTVYTTTVTVNPLPSSTGATNSGPICIGGGPVTLTAHSSNATAWSWSGPGGFVSGSQNPVISPTPTVTGTYSLTLSSTGGAGCSPATVYTTTVTVNNIPTINVTPASGVYCSGSGGISMTASGANTYSWSPSAGLNTNTGATVTGTSTVTSTYTITGTSIAGCIGTNTVTTTFGGVAPLTPTITPTFINACAGGATNLLTATEGAAGPSTGSVTTFTCTGTNPGSANAVTTSAIPLSGMPAVIFSPTVSVTINFQSNYLSDYIINLVAPNGNIINLSTGHGVNSNTLNNYTNTVISSTGVTTLGSTLTPFTGTFAADGSVGSGVTPYISNTNSWSSLCGTPNGTWELVIYNTYGGGTNSGAAFTNWSLNVNYTQPGITWSPATGLYTNSGGTSGYLGAVTNTVYENPSATGVTTYTATATNGSCTSSATITATVNALPAAVTASGAGTYCGNATINASNGGDGTIFFQGTTSNGTSTVTPSVSQTVSVTGTYYFRAKSASGCWGPQGSVTVSVNPVPSSTGATNSGVVCAGTSATLNANSSNATSWSWNGSDGFSSSLQNPTVTPSVTTTYSLTVSSTGGGCNPSTVYTTTVMVNPVPSSTGATNSGSICVGGTAALSANSSDATSWSWTGPGFSSSLPNPGVTPGVTTTYSLTLSSTGSGCNPSTVYTTTVTVNPVPSSTGATNSGVVCAGTSATLSDNSSDATSWSWSGSDGFSSSLPSPTVTPSATTTYSLTLSSTGIGCNPSTVYTTTVTVNPVPSSTGATNSGSICVGGTATLSANSSDATSWSWTGPGFSSSLTNPSVTPSVTTTYSLTLSSTGSGCNPSTVYTTTVTVNPVPSSTGATNSGVVCAGTSATLNANSSDATSWSWTAPGFSSSLPNPSVTPSITTTFSLTLSSTGSGCNPSTVYTTTVTVNPVPSSIGATNSGVVCAGTSATLSDNSSNATSWSWNGSDGFSSSLPSPTVTPSATTTYSLTLSSTGSGCNPSTVYTTTVTVNPVPSSTGATNSGVVCTGTSATLNANSSNATSWSWTGPGFSSSLPNPSVTPSVTTTFSLTLSSTGSGCNPSTVYTTTVTVNPVPSSTGVTNSGAMCAGGSSTLSANSSNATSWLWIGSDGFTSSLQNPVVTPTATATYSLAVSSIGSGCSPSMIYTTTVTVYSIGASASNSGVACAGGSITLIPGETGTAPSVTYAWSGPAGYISSLSNPVLSTVTTAEAGIYHLTVTAPGASCTANSSTIVTVNAAPVASPVNSGVICSGGTVMLHANGTGSTSVYLWSGLNLASTTAANTTAQPAPISLSATMVVYTLTVTDGTTNSGCSNTYTNTVTVTPAPLASPSTDGAICTGTTASLYSNGGGSTSDYLWSGLNLSSTADSDPTANPAATSVYTLTVTDGTTNSGCTMTYNITVTVDPVPTAVPTNDGAVCAGGTVNLNAHGTATGTPTFSWSGPAGFSSYTAISALTGVTTDNAGVYTVTVGAEGSVCTATGTTNVVVKPSPSLSGTNSNSPLCAGQTLMLTAGTPLNVTGYSWSGPNSFTSTLPNPIVASSTTAATGIYTVNVVNGTGSGCTVAFTTTTTINPLPVITGSNILCAGSTTTFTETAGSGTWSSSNAHATVDASGNVTGVTAGNPIITFTQASTGCYSTQSVTVNAQPVPIGGTLNVCVGATTHLTDGTGGVWTSSAPLTASIGSGTGIVSGLTAGTSLISYSNSGCMASARVTVNNLPAAVTVGTSGIYCGSATITADNGGDGTMYYQGLTSGGTSTSRPYATTTVSVTGTYYFRAMSAAGCWGAEGSVTVTINPMPATISGSTNICLGTPGLLTDGGGGTWASSDGTIASIASTGTVTGVGAGTATITYTLGTGCYRTTTVTVNPISNITGNSAPICTGLSETLSDATTPGTWSSASGSIATVAVSSGIVTAVGVGNTTITYTSGSGCMAFTQVTVNLTPIAISGGTQNICNGQATTFNSGTPGGTWSSSDNTIASVGTGGGVSGVGAGSATITYTTTNGCFVTRTVTVNPISAIVGNSPVCVNATINLTNDASGGTWISSLTDVASINGSSGVVTGLSNGVSSITYTTAAGCRAITAVTVNPLPSVITGNANVCLGLTTSLNDASSGGAWSSSSNVSVDGSGLVTGLTLGTATVTYTFTSTSCARTLTVSVNAVPTTISGVAPTCAGSTMSLSADVTGGIWSSSNSAVATINSGTGMVAGVAGGTATITYTTGSNCYTTTTITINPILAIGGTAVACIGSTTTLSDGTPGGTWSSSDPTTATVGSGGIVSGIALGTATVTYTIPSGCARTVTVTVNAPVASITGNAPTCQGSSIALTGGTGGSWSTGNPSVATVNASTGVVLGINIGTTTITYSAGAGCFTTTVVSVNTAMQAITGSGAVCLNGTTTLHDVTTSGTWSSSNTAVGTIDQSSGTFTGLSVGTSTITYELLTGCYRVFNISVSPLPAPITGNTTVCLGSSTSLYDATTPANNWTSSNTGVATILVSGVVTPVSAGSTTITYTTGSTGCSITISLFVTPLPGPISSNTPMCIGASTITLSDTGSGSWSSSNATIAAIGSSTGSVTGASAGTAMITYSLAGAGCRTTAIVTVNPSAPITGTAVVCSGSTITLANSVPGGTWSVASGSAAGIGSTGIVTGLAQGTSTISYTLTSGCNSGIIVTVNPLPSAITGNAPVCVGGNLPLASSGSGTWTSSNGNAAVDGSGNVTGMAAGTSVITFATGAGCITTAVVTVNSIPSITGAGSVCAGSAITLTASISGGTWSSLNTAAGTIGTSTGIFAGIAAGTSVVSYLPATGCGAAVIITVNPIPGAITGALNACTGSEIQLSETSTGGSWSSSNTSVATVDAIGFVHGYSAGQVNISYTFSTGCYVNATVTVTTQPANISGSSVVCAGSAITLTDGTPGGSWSSVASTAAVGTSGVVTGLSSGTAAITYATGPGCQSAIVITVNPLPSAISVPSGACQGASIQLTDVTSGGIWTSSTGSVATIGSGSGILTGVNSGATTIQYTLPTGCGVSTIVSVNPMAGAISGSTSVCAGAATTLTDAGGGTWSSSNALIGTIGSASGIFTGVAVGSATVTYTLPTGCARTVNVIVNALPVAITGNTMVCAGASTTLFDATTPALSWSSNNTGVATINGGGVVSALTAGSTTITYTANGGCSITTTLSVTALPAAISGNAATCIGSSAVTLTDAGGGTWTSSNTSIATVGSSTGTLTGTAAGNATITYSVAGAGCYTTAVVTVNPPSAITGTTSFCAGGATTLGNSISGGTWTSTGTASVGSATGVVTGVTPGTSTISYILPSGCNSGAVVTINALPSAINGNNGPVCAGTVLPLSNTGSGAWSSSSSTVATVDGSGNVTGVSAGNAAITFTSGAGCITTSIVTVNSSPAISGTAMSVCAGSIINLNANIAGGTWSSVNSLAGTVGSATGVVTGIAAGNTTISYSIASGCGTAVTVTVNPLPSPISGTLSVCVGGTTTLTSSGGGTWSSSNAGGATVNTSGMVTGVGASNTFIYYTLGTGCVARATVTVTALPSSITGPMVVCAGSGIGLSDATTGGTWSTADAAATVGTTGVVNGISAGTATITYATGASCMTTSVVTVSAQPSAFSVPVICQGASSSPLTDGTSGGVWTSSITSVAMIGSSSGIITGINTGSTIIQYTLPSGCSISSTVTVNPTAGAISGATTVCPGASGTLTDAGGGTWSSSNTAIGTIGLTTGVFTGITSGSATVVYTLPTGCARSINVVVNTLPAPITGNTTVCLGATTTLYDATTPASSWVSGNAAVATINGGGVVSTVAVGSATIIYTPNSGCATTTTVYVTALPDAITGNAPICAGSSSVTLSDAGGGTWSSSNAAIATIGSATGTLGGISAGNATVTYTTAGAGCYKTVAVTVNPTPSITGTPVVCAGSTINLGNTISGGTWSSTGGAAAIGSSTGVVTGSAAGTSTISYILATGCNSAVVVTVNSVPSGITGNTPVCVGAQRALSNTGSGTWSCSNGNISIDGSGNVTGVTAGTSIVTFTVPGGCMTTTVVTVSPVPSITGTMGICPGATTTLTGSISGGTWTSLNAGAGTIGSASGIVTGIAAGSTTISYMVATGCANAAVVTINPLPSPITGAGSVCAGTTLALSEISSGGTWSSSNTAQATVSTAGNVTGVTTGTPSISYTLPTGCVTRVTVTVSAAPGAITGNTPICSGAANTLLNSVTGGVWASLNTGNATVGSSNGVVQGLAAGTATITYNTSASCTPASVVVTINQAPSAITPLNVCQSASTTLNVTPSGGTWVSAVTSVATIGSSTGVIVGANTGVTTITYTATNGCRAINAVTVNAAPGAISGSSSVCAGGATTTLTCAGGGTWSTANAAVALVGSTGIVTGVGAGSTTIIYTLSTGCARGIVMTSKPQPAPITGTLFMCLGAANTLHDATTPANNWISSNAAIATINAGGVVTSVAAGTTTISYTTSSNGCSIAAVLTVNPAPSAGVITAPATVATTATITATSSGTTGGTWSVSNVHASVDPVAGIVTGVSAGTFTLTYTVATCATVTATKLMTESGPAPAPVAGGNTIVLNTGSVAQLASDELSGGLWSSSDNTVATVDPVSGLLTAVAAGNALVSYSITNANGDVSTSTRPVVVSSSSMDVRVLPNPNNGVFTVRGTVGTDMTEEVTLEVTDLLGQVVYKSKVTAVNGMVNERLLLDGSLTNGMYMLNVHAGMESRSFHFVIAK